MVQMNPATPDGASHASGRRCRDGLGQCRCGLDGRTQRGHGILASPLVRIFRLVNASLKEFAQLNMCLFKT